MPDMAGCTQATCGYQRSYTPDGAAVGDTVSSVIGVTEGISDLSTNTGWTVGELGLLLGSSCTADIGGAVHVNDEVVRAGMGTPVNIMAWIRRRDKSKTVGAWWVTESLALTTKRGGRVDARYVIQYILHRQNNRGIFSHKVILSLNTCRSFLMRRMPWAPSVSCSQRALKDK